MISSDSMWNMFRGEKQKEPIPYTKEVIFDKWFEPLDLQVYAPGEYQPKRRRYASTAGILASIPLVSHHNSISNSLKSRPKVYRDLYRATNLPPFVEIPMPGQTKMENHMTPYNRVKLFNQYYSKAQQEWLPDFKDLNTGIVNPWVRADDISATNEAVTAFVTQTSLPHNSAVANPTEEELEIKAASMKVAQAIRNQASVRNNSLATATALAGIAGTALLHNVRERNTRTRLPAGANAANFINLSQHPGPDVKIVQSDVKVDALSSIDAATQTDDFKSVVPLEQNPNDNPGLAQQVTDVVDLKYLSERAALQALRDFVVPTPTLGNVPGNVQSDLKADALASGVNASNVNAEVALKADAEYTAKYINALPRSTYNLRSSKHG